MTCIILVTMIMVATIILRIIILIAIIITKNGPTIVAAAVVPIVLQWNTLLVALQVMILDSLMIHGLPKSLQDREEKTKKPKQGRNQRFPRTCVFEKIAS